MMRRIVGEVLFIEGKLVIDGEEINEFGCWLLAVGGACDGEDVCL